jgi:lactoylglutathione lyase
LNIHPFFKNKATLQHRKDFPMSNEIPPASSADAHFSFTKLVVDDLEKTHSFYTSVCGVVEQFRYESAIGNRQISEICYAPTAAGGGAFTLLQYIGARKPENGELILGFTTNDIDAFVTRAEAAGGRIADPIRSMPDLNLRVAFVEDCEGHLIEVVQML